MGEAMLEVVDAADLTDDHLESIDKVKHAYEVEAIDGFWDALEMLGDGDIVFQITIASASFLRRFAKPLRM